MGGLDGYLPVMVMIGLQCHYSLLAIFTRAALLDGLTPTVFVVYRQGIATLALAPIIFSSNKRYISSLNQLLSFFLFLPSHIYHLCFFFFFFFYCRRQSFKASLGLKSFSMMFMTSLIGYSLQITFDSFVTCVIYFFNKINK